jgi:aspartate/methionine/tyrosine aminotransferase
MPAAGKFQLNARALASVAGELAGVIVASPSNPVGAVIQENELRLVADHCRQRGARLVSDEVYHGITFGAQVASLAGIDENAIVVNSFSKYFCMTGWRLGWLIAPPDLLRPIERLAQNLFISPPSLSQSAAIAAFESYDELQANVARYAANRDILLNGLPEAGFSDLIATDGAFYVYADVSKLTNDSVQFCRRMLVEAGVAATPGVDFDADRGHHWMRFSFAGATSDMAKAIRRLRDWKK